MARRRASSEDTQPDAAGVGVDLTIQPGMKVYVMGAPTVWGVGGFTVHQGGTLSLARITLAQTAHIAVSVGGSLALADLALRSQLRLITTTMHAGG